MIGILADQSLAELGVNDLPWIMPPPEVEEALEIVGMGDPLRQGFAWLAFWETELLFDFYSKRFWLKTGGRWSKPLPIADHREHILQQVTYARTWHRAVKAQQKLKNDTKGKQTK
jgi:hypothetical protein